METSQEEIYNAMVASSERDDREADAIDILIGNEGTLKALHAEYNRVKSIAIPAIQKEGDEHIKESILLLINTHSARSLSQKQLLKALEPTLKQYPHSLTPEQMHEFYKRNITQYQTLKPTPKPKLKAIPKQPKPKGPQEVQTKSNQW